MSSLVEQILMTFRATAGPDLDLRNHHLTAAEWVELARRVDEFHSVVTFRMTSSSTLPDGLAFASRLPALKRGQFSSCTDADVALAVEKLPHLTSFSLRECEHVTDDGLGAIARGLPKLTRLDLTWCAQVTDAGIHALTERLPELTYLDLSRCERVTDVGVRAVAERLSKLTNLNLNGCDRVTDIGVRSVAEKLCGLVSLNISGVKVTGVGIRPLAERLSDLTSLELTWCVGVTDDDVAVLTEHLTKLTTLALAGCQKVTDTGVSILSQRVPQLTSLDLAGCEGVSDVGVVAVTNHLRRLTYLNLAACVKVTDASVCEVANQLPRLNYLNLGWCSELTDVAVEAVATRLGALTYLNLSGCVKVTDAGVRAVAERLHGLTKLNLSGCEQLTDAGLQTVAEQLNGLTYLNVSGCERVTEVGLRRLAEAYRSGRLAKLSTLQIVETKSGLSEEVVATQSPEVIFRALLAADTAPLREAKLLLVGDGEVGKSHLKDRLGTAPYAFDASRMSTHDIDFTLWDATPERPRTRLWDFGGQPHLHGSHRFFLGADHAAYVLVLDVTRTAADNHLNYWLRFIAHYGRSARAGERTPVVLVLNKCDVLTLATSAEFSGRWRQAETVRNNAADLNAGIKMAEVSGWHGANVVGSPVGGLGTFSRVPGDYQYDKWLGTLPKDVQVPNVLHDQILEQHTRALAKVNAAITCALNLVPAPSVGYPAAFHQLKEHLELKLRAARPPEKPVPWVSTHGDEWRADVVARYGLPMADVEVWLKTLRSLGIVHWVGDFDAVERGEYPTIRHRLFNPHWVKGPVYEVVNPRTGAHTNGRVTQRTLQSQLAGYSPDEREAVLELMLACKVAFKVRDKLSGEFQPDRLIPDLLGARDRPDVEPTGSALRWRFDVPFLSDRVLLRYIGEHYEDITDHQLNCWRNRVAFRWPANTTCWVCVTSELEGTAASLPYLRLEVTGDEPRAREVIANEVRLELARILFSEGLIESHEKLVTVDEHQALTREEWFRQLLRSAGLEGWVSEEEGRRQHGDRTGRREVTPETFRDYRKKFVARLRLDDDSGGVDKNGYLWRRQGRDYLYLKSSLRNPVMPP